MALVAEEVKPISPRRQLAFIAPYSEKTWKVRIVKGSRPEGGKGYPACMLDESLSLLSP